MASFTHPISFVKEAAPFVHLCWKMGWNEANGGNFSWRLPTGEIEGILARHYPDLTPGPAVPMPIDEPDLDGEYFLVTGSGQFFRHALDHPNQVFGIVQIVAGGTAWRQVWGFSSGARPTSEFATHLVAHAVRKRVSNGRERMILHAHPPEFIALSFLEDLDSRVLTRALWEKMPECIVIFPDGVQVVPLFLPGTVEIAEASAAGLAKSRVISWSHHGIFVSEESPNKVFALVETIEKSAAIHRKVLSAGGPKRAISTDILRQLAEKFAAIMVARPEGLDDGRAMVLRAASEGGGRGAKNPRDGEKTSAPQLTYAPVSSDISITDGARRNRRGPGPSGALSHDLHAERITPVRKANLGGSYAFENDTCRDDILDGARLAGGRADGD